MSRDELLSRIWIDPKRCFGKPCIRGTRITVELILRKLGAGRSFAELLEAYPQLSTDPCNLDPMTGACIITGLAVTSIDIVFDEGQDSLLAGPDQFGVAILDNIDVNGVLVGQDVF